MKRFTLITGLIAWICCALTRLLRIPVALVLNQFRVEIIRRPSGRRLTPLDRIFFFIANVGWLFVRTAIQLVWGRSQVILIPDLPAPYTISQGNLAIPRRYNSKVKLIGPIVELHEDPNSEDTRVVRELAGSKRPLIYAAVSGPRVERETLARILLDALQGMNGYQIVLSRGDPTGDKTPHHVDGIIVFDWVENQDELIKASDLVVSRAGHGTIMRSMIHGKPMLLVPIPDHTEQYGNALRAKSLHVAEIIDQNKLNHELLKSTIDKVLSDKEYSLNAARIGRETGRDAVSTACDAIQALTIRT